MKDKLALGGNCLRKVILQPTGGAGEANYEKTIRLSVPLKKVLPYLNEKDATIIKSYYPDGVVPIWGVNPGKDEGNRKKWDKIEVGDIALFTASMQVVASGTVTHKVHSKELALKLWGWKEENVTWEYIYLLDEIEERAIPVLNINEVIGYKKNYIVRGFTVLDEEKSKKFISSFDIVSEIYTPDIEKEKYEDAIFSLDSLKPLDAEVTAKRRTEQDYLRKNLFRNMKVANCGICSEEMPVQFLVAAHIKKRMFCSTKEKLDAENIVMPMCRFGCDDLYEKGYISVADGRVIKINDKNLTTIVEKYIEKIVGKPCVHWNEKTADYFKWHLEYHFDQGTRLTSVW